MRILLCFLLSILSFSTMALPESCIIADKPTQLSGIINTETFPGLPNYESIKKGDQPETYWILTTNKPHCGTGEDFLNDGQKITKTNQTRFQLILTEAQYKQWNNLLSKKVSVEGTMMLAHTGHHHTEMLIEVTKITGE
jgi:hypothetical protein